MNTTHTPGPWHVSSANPWNVIAPREDEPDRDCLVGTCYIHGRNHRTYEANARLIAAAPDLLAALEFVCEFYQRNFDVMPVAFQTVDGIARAAIAKAKGTTA